MMATLGNDDELGYPFWIANIIHRERSSYQKEPMA